MPSATKVTVSLPKELQKELRDELRMTAAMRCYSIMRSGGSKSLNAQYEYMSSLYHGDAPSIASNIKMLCCGSYVYRDMYDTHLGDSILTKSSDTNAESRHRLSLKVELSRDKSRVYFAEEDIFLLDLEKKGRKGKQLVSGRNILDLAKKGTANYRKALSFASKKLDLETMSVKESGNTLDDVIEYVRVEMYQLHLKDEAIKKKTIVLDDNEDDDNMNIEDEYLCSLKSNSNDKASTSSSSDKESIETKDDKQKVMSDIQKSESSKCDTPKNKNAKPNKDEKPRIIPPPQWFFPCWISFVQYGPFVSKDKDYLFLKLLTPQRKL